MLTRDLKKSNANEVVHGKLIINLTTNVNTPANHPGTPGNMGATSTGHTRNLSVSSTSNQRANPAEGSSHSTSLSTSAPSMAANGQNSNIAGSSSNTTSAANGRTFGSFEDQYGSLPPG